MENKASWHGKAPNDEEFSQAMKERQATKELDQAGGADGK